MLSKVYIFWTAKHNLQVDSDTIILIREKDFHPFVQLDDYIKKMQIKG